MPQRAGRSPEEDALLEKAARLLPGGVLGGYSVPRDLSFIRALLERGVVKASQKFYVSLAHGEEDVRQTTAAFTAALRAVAEQRPTNGRTPS